MTLIRLGEVVDLPQKRRAKLMERQAEEARLAREQRVHDESRDAACMTSERSGGARRR